MQVMTNEQLESRLKSLRVKATITKILTYCAALTMILVWFFTGKLIIGLIFLVIALVFGYLSSKNSSEIKKILSDNVISGVLREALGDNVEYNPWGKAEPGSMVLPFDYNRACGSDYIKSVHRGRNIELSNIELINETEEMDGEGFMQKSSVTQFKGQWLICDFGKELIGNVYLSANDRNLRKHHKNDSVEMGNETFNNRFLVTAQNAQDAYHIFTPRTMEYILAMANQIGGEVYMSFLRDGKMQVAVKTGREFFELGKSKADVEELRRKFLGELRWFIDMIDTLCAEDTICKRETDI